MKPVRYELSFSVEKSAVIVHWPWAVAQPFSLMNEKEVDKLHAALVTFEYTSTSNPNLSRNQLISLLRSDVEEALRPQFFSRPGKPTIDKRSDGVVVRKFDERGKEKIPSFFELGLDKLKIGE